MKICFFAPSNSSHTKKWCRFFCDRGHEVHVISFCEEEIEGAYLHYIPTSVDTSGGDGQKLGYLLKAGAFRRLVKEIDPDVLNVHYATSYGVVAALSGVRGYLLTVWGSDIYLFPRKSLLHKLLLQFSLKRAKILCSSSLAMAREAALYSKKKFEIIPFGVDLDLFSPRKRDRCNDGHFVIGTVKSLAPVYGIDHLLRAAAILCEEHPEISLKVRIAGDGPSREEYHQLSRDLGIDDITEWLGFISPEQAAKEWANMDLAVICSRSESFGVSAVEAQACGCPLVISDIPGLKESACPGYSCVVAERNDPKHIAEAVLSLAKDPEKREELGQNGRTYVEENFELEKCFLKAEELFCYALKKDR